MPCAVSRGRCCRRELDYLRLRCVVGRLQDSFLLLLKAASVVDSFIDPMLLLLSVSGRCDVFLVLHRLADIRSRARRAPSKVCWEVWVKCGRAPPLLSAQHTHSPRRFPMTCQGLCLQHFLHDSRRRGSSCSVRVYACAGGTAAHVRACSISS